MEAAEAQSLNHKSSASQLPKPPGHAALGGDPTKYEKRSRRAGGGCCKLIILTVILIILLLLTIAAIAIWESFKRADMPNFTVQRLAVSKFNVDEGFRDKQSVVTTDLEFHLEADNKKNGMIGTKFGSMVLEVSWDDTNARLGEAKVPVFESKTGKKTELKIGTHGEADILRKGLAKEDLKLDAVLSGNVNFFWGPFKSKDYPFMVSCSAISTASANSLCNAKLYSSSAPPQRTSPSVSPAPESPKEDALVEEGGATPKDNKTQSPGEAPSPGGPDKQAEAPLPPPKVRAGPPVRLMVHDKDVVLDNGIFQATISKPGGFVTGIKYNGIENILGIQLPEDDRGYWDVVWAPLGTKGTKGTFDRIKGSIFRVIIEKEDQVELSFLKSFDPAMKGEVAALDVDQRYVMLRGESGIYAYAILERKNWPGINLPNARLAFKLDKDKFQYMAVADNRQRDMPLPEDRLKDRGQVLAYPEAVLLVNPVNSNFKGEVDDKYQYSDESQDIQVHGWICKDPPTGFWQITPSYEFRSGGPNKQFLTSHVGPSTLAMFVSAHYSGEELIPKFEDNEPWKKVLGPVFMYFNSVPKGQDFHLLWDNAKKKMMEEVQSWPYSFPASEDFPKANQRANVSGRLFVHDRYLDQAKVPAKRAFVGLALPGEAGSWQRECKGYQFWTQTDEEGRFVIAYARPGNYNIYGWVDGYVGDFKHNAPVEVKIGHSIDLGDLLFEPPRDGPTIWEIGEPERTAKEFFIPDPDPKYVNKLYVNHPDKFRQYGLWERYAELYPKDDVVYTVNVSDYKKDWFFAQVTRKVADGYDGSTWQIKFNLSNVDTKGVYKLRLALASATNAELEVRLNEPPPAPFIFSSGRIGNDNSIARHGIHGLFWLYNIDIEGAKMKQGENIMYLTQVKSSSPFQGVMYDYIRLEGPPSK
ncbi:hypothetical protein Ancab_029004 [Ancistrocladus abbreviatus]